MGLLYIALLFGGMCVGALLHHFGMPADPALYIGLSPFFAMAAYLFYGATRDVYAFLRSRWGWPVWLAAPLSPVILIVGCLLILIVLIILIAVAQSLIGGLLKWLRGDKD
jgi:hypothetical protein